MVTEKKVQVLIDELNKRADMILAKESYLNAKEAKLDNREKRLDYRELNVAKREKIINGKSGI